MPSTSVTFTNRDINKILNHEAPYDSSGGWGNGIYIVLEWTLTYDADSTGMSTKRCVVDAGINYTGSPHAPLLFDDHRFRIFFNGDIGTHISNMGGTMRYAQYSSSLGYFVERDQRSVGVSKTTYTINSTRYTYLNVITTTYQRFITRAGLSFSGTENEFVDATNVDSNTCNEMMAQAAYDYFNAQPIETFSVDMDVWSTADSYFTFEISNLQGAALPAASYFYRLAYNPAGDRQ